jgi:glycosyltransferase involved in cell wall biosynthesis
MRVLQVHNRYRSAIPSGENRVVDLESRWLRLHGHQVERFERSSDAIDTWPAPRKALLPGQVLWSTDSYRALRRILRGNRPDVVHVHNVYPLLSPSVLYACAREGVPVVATLHNYRPVCTSGNLFRDGAPCYDCVGRLPTPALRHGCYRDSRLATVPWALASEIHGHAWRTLVSAYICISHFQRQTLAPARFAGERLFVKHNLVPFVESPAPRSSVGDTIVFTGRLDEAKGIPLLMDAWELYVSAAKTRPLRLVIAGTGPLADVVEKWARTRNDVEAAGLLSAAGCRQLMTNARAAVAPAQWLEPFGLVVVEAMAAGVAVIGPAHAALPELLVDRQEGRLFEPGNPRSLAELFHDAERSPDCYARYGCNARRAYETRFDPDDNVEQLVSIYKYAIENPVRASEHTGDPVEVASGAHANAVARHGVDVTEA